MPHQHGSKAWCLRPPTAHRQMHAWLEPQQKANFENLRLHSHHHIPHLLHQHHHHYAPDENTREHAYSITAIFIVATMIVLVLGLLLLLLVFIFVWQIVSKMFSKLKQQSTIRAYDSYPNRSSFIAVTALHEVHRVQQEKAAREHSTWKSPTPHQSKL